MDTSKTYIKLCEKAEEIQGLIAPLNIRKPDYQSQCGADMSKSGDWWHLNTWLPRQDQLQEMIDFEVFQNVNDLEHKEFNINDFVWFCEFGYGNIFKKQPKEVFTSMEQLWLAFIMKVLYSKVWDDNKWVIFSQ